MAYSRPNSGAHNFRSREIDPEACRSSSATAWPGNVVTQKRRRADGDPDPSAHHRGVDSLEVRLPQSSSGRRTPEVRDTPRSASESSGARSDRLERLGAARLLGTEVTILHKRLPRLFEAEVNPRGFG